MKVILLEDVKDLGQRGKVVEVKPGYGRNYLLPRGLAIPATPQNLRQLENRLRAAGQRADRELGEARRVAAALEGRTVRIAARAGEGGRLFGSVTKMDIAEALEAATGHAIDRRKIDLEESLKSLGPHRVAVRLHPEVTVEVTVDVVPAEG